MKKGGKDIIKLVEETIGLVSNQNTIIDKLNSLVDSLKSVDTDKLNVNQKSAEIMMPSDIQAQYRPAIAETSTPLTASDTYQSDSFDASNYRRYTYLLYADQDGDLYIDESIDGTNWYYSEHVAYTASNGAVVGELNIHGKYLRVRYVNGGTDQTEFSLGVYAAVV